VKKRLERAVQRLRQHLNRSGGETGSLLSVVLLHGFAEDARHALPSPAAVTSKAMAMSAAGASSFTTLALLLMTKKTTLIVIASLLLCVGAALFYFKQQGRAAGHQHAPANSARSAVPSSTRGNFEASGEPARPHDPAANPELIAQYGESRVKLSKHVATGILDFVDGFGAMKEMSASTRFGRGMDAIEDYVYLGDHAENLQFAGEQKKQVSKLQVEAEKRYLAGIKATTDGLRKDLTPLMTGLLAMDALKRQAINVDDYQKMEITLDGRVRNFMESMNPETLNRSDLLTDASFVTALQPLLNPDQLETFRAAREAQLADAAAKPQGPQASAESARDLEKTEAKISGLKKMVEGMTKMMEGADQMPGQAPGDGE